MELFSFMRSESMWDEFLQYRMKNDSIDLRKLERWILQKDYLPLCDQIEREELFPLPRKVEISKMGTEKKRIVYVYPENENFYLKHLTYRLIRLYDHLFTPNLYSFRAHHGAKEAIQYITSRRKISQMFSYKVDISNYFNSIDLDLLLPELENVLAEDPDLFRFLKRLLSEPAVLSEGKRVIEEKGIMAGTPQACFHANLYLRDMDRYFYEQRILYARYSDDIIVFAETEEELMGYVQKIHEFLEKKKLKINSKKEFYSKPHEMWTFLGFSFLDGSVDIAPASVVKMKHKMRRKTRALERWYKRKGLSGEKGAIAFIKAFNRKLYQSSEDSDFTWTRWFFPVITTSSSLHVIDQYAEECIRYLVTGKHTKGRFQCTYETIKTLGFRPLVHEYYHFKKTEKVGEG